MIAFKKILIKTRFYLVDLISPDGFLHQNMVFLCVFFCVSFSALFLTLSGFISKRFCSFRRIERARTNDSNESASLRDNNRELDLRKTEETEPEKIDSTSMKTDEEESPKLVFKFEYQTQTFEQLRKEGYRGEENDVFSGSSSSSTANKHETKPLKHLNGFVENTEDVSFTVEKLLSEPVKDSVENNGFFLDGDFLQEKSSPQETEESANGLCREEETTKNNLVEDENDDSSEEFRFLEDKDFTDSPSSDSFSSGFDSTSQFIASTTDGFLSDSDFDEEMFDTGEVEGSSVLDSETRRDDDKDYEEKGKRTELGSDSEDDSNGLESLWEHQDLIEQLKMELKKVRAIGLPTILEEEDDCPKIIEDLKPWKIDDNKFQHGNPMGELHKFYKSYRERMRKFDILNYQKMYTLGLLQSKDPLQAISTLKSSPPPSLTSILSSNLRLWKPRKSEYDPMLKFMKELHSELEMVYVGQLCLSWEILQWQYEKAVELWESDDYGIRRYNEVSGEFQQFQVLIQRFLENEPFEGPRVQNYVKKRCVLRNLLQVPVIREDSNKNRKKMTRTGGDCDDDGAITTDKLVEVMEESIRIFWKFVQADKHANSTFRKARTKAKIGPQDPQGLEMFAEIKATLQIKEKKLKDALRSGCCILRKFRKHREEEDGSEQVLYFFSQVDMRLVARVLNMSKLTREHLLWCHSKLSRINFVRRKIHVEPSFCLFPC